MRRFYIVSFSIRLQHCAFYGLLLPLNMSTKDIYLLHGKISTQSVIRLYIFKVS